MSTTPADQHETDLTARAELEKERLRLKRNLKFLKKTDDLDTSIYSVVESWLDKPLTEDEKRHDIRRRR